MRFSLLDFMSDHSKNLPTLWIRGQCEESRRIVEVGCERFFNLAGYVSSAKRTALLVRNYERLAMLSSLIQKVYIDEELVAEEYLSMYLLYIQPFSNFKDLVTLQLLLFPTS